MSLAKQRPRFETPADYEDDVFEWAFQQAELLRQRRFGEADLPNIIEELESMGREQRRALMSSYRLLISHLLKWEYQNTHRSRSWEVTILRERANIHDREADNHSLAVGSGQLVQKVYEKAVREAVTETGLSRDSFPARCPYSLEQLRDEDWLPS